MVIIKVNKRSFLYLLGYDVSDVRSPALNSTKFTFLFSVKCRRLKMEIILEKRQFV